MSSPKVFEYAKELGLETLALMDKIREWKLPVKSHMAELTPEMMEEIQKRLNPEPAAGAAAKKKVVKKAAAPKAAASKTAAPKAAAPKTTAKAAAKTTKAKDVDAKGKTAAAKSATTAKRVIRRKAGEAAEEAPAEAVEAPIEMAAAEPAVVEEIRPVAAAPVEEVAEPVKVAASAPAAEEPAAEVAAPEEKSAPQARRMREVVMTPKGPSSGVRSESAISRTNIVGRMDLSRVQPQPRHGGGQQGGAPGSGPGGAAGQRGPRPAGGPAGRNLRTGFFAVPVPQPMDPEAEFNDRDKRLDEKTPKKRPGAGKTDGPEVTFSATEFRKREMVFQPKKKKDSLNREAKQTQITKPAAHKRVVRMENNISVGELASAMNVKAPQLIKSLMGNGVMANMNTMVDYETAALIAPEFGFEVSNVFKTVDEVLNEQAFGDLTAELVPRTPVVTVMGHVDHGKTSLLDAIRNAKVAAGEAGGITQHIGAYQVTLDTKQTITFLDTPGHEAFTAMRARGANATDVAIIVVAADDGVMPQTVEAISHAKAANVPIIVAVNKMDRPNANADRIKKQLTEYELVPEEWGGTTIYCPVSALKKEGIKELLEQIVVVSEVLELKANPKRSGTGLVIESRLEKGRGPVATILVKDGTVEVGQWIVAGQAHGRVRSMMDYKGQQKKTAGPGEPIEILGLGSTPLAGDRFDITHDEDTARDIAERRGREIDAEESKASSEKLSLEAIFAKVQQGEVKELPIVLKADVAGSVEAIKGIFDKLSTPEVKIKLIHSAVGGISESDVLLGSTAKGLIIGFNVRPDSGAQAMAKRHNIEIKTYSIVYELADDMKKAMSGLLKPEVVETNLGRAEVRNIFTVPKAGTIAGCAVIDGKVARNNRVRLVRDGRIIYTGNMSSLKRFKDDVREVAQGYECGIGIENYNDLKVGDIIEAFMEQSIAREI